VDAIDGFAIWNQGANFIMAFCETPQEAMSWLKNGDDNTSAVPAILVKSRLDDDIWDACDTVLAQLN